MLNQITELLETLAVLEDARDTARIVGLVTTRVAPISDLNSQITAARHELYACRNQRLKRFSLNQLNDRLGKLVAGNPERLEIIHEIQARSLMEEARHGVS